MTDQPTDEERVAWHLTPVEAIQMDGDLGLMESNAHYLHSSAARVAGFARRLLNIYRDDRHYQRLLEHQRELERRIAKAEEWRQWYKTGESPSVSEIRHLGDILSGEDQ